MKRRQFLRYILNTALLALKPIATIARENRKMLSSSRSTRLFFCGDVMIGRGIDQVLPHPSDPRLYETFVVDARRYVEIAEQTNGPISRPVSYSYIWGDALGELTHRKPDVRLINLETSITRSDDYWRDKGINYRMHPDNITCLTAAGIDCCALANNHVMDWGYAGLNETLKTLHSEKIRTTGAGHNRTEAETPATIHLSDNRRVIVFSFGTESSGIPHDWAADTDRPGVNFLANLSNNTVRRIKKQVDAEKRSGDTVVASIHWGSNWGYNVPEVQTHFAHKLIDVANVDFIHGHSSHHVKGIEVYKGKLIVYGCGDFLNDYEGIAGNEQFRDDLALMYFAEFETPSGKLGGLKMVPMQIRRFQSKRATINDARWLKDTLTREGTKFGTSVKFSKDDALELIW